MLCGRCFKWGYVLVKVIYGNISVHMLEHPSVVKKLMSDVLIYHVMIQMMSFNLKVKCGILGILKAHNFLYF